MRQTQRQWQRQARAECINHQSDKHKSHRENGGLFLVRDELIPLLLCVFNYSAAAFPVNAAAASAEPAGVISKSPSAEAVEPQNPAEPSS